MCYFNQKNPASLLGICVLYRRDPPGPEAWVGGSIPTRCMPHYQRFKYGLLGATVCFLSHFIEFWGVRDSRLEFAVPFNLSVATASVLSPK
jgi:hypothetical protein